MVSTVYNFSGVRNLDPSHWNKLSEFGSDTVSLRQAALWELESTIAKAQARKPCNINVDEDLPSARGYYDPKKREIHVSRADLEGNVSPHEAVNTVAHEGRHDYQHHVANYPERHPEASDVNKARWANNLAPGNYVRPTTPETFESYKNQPVEVDCRHFANLVEMQVCGERLAQAPITQTPSLKDQPTPDWKAKWASHTQDTKVSDPPEPVSDDALTKIKGRSR